VEDRWWSPEPGGLQSEEEDEEDNRSPVWGAMGRDGASPEPGGGWQIIQPPLQCRRRADGCPATSEVQCQGSASSSRGTQEKEEEDTPEEGGVRQPGGMGDCKERCLAKGVTYGQLGRGIQWRVFKI
jgi:hypothetical protein